MALVTDPIADMLTRIRNALIAAGSVQCLPQKLLRLVVFSLPDVHVRQTQICLGIGIVQFQRLFVVRLGSCQIFRRLPGADVGAASAKECLRALGINLNGRRESNDGFFIVAVR